MFVVNAGLALLNPYLARVAAREAPTAVSVQASPAQCAAWSAVGVKLGASSKYSESLFPLTLAGLPLRADSTVSDNVVEFLDAAGGILGRIECLSLPQRGNSPKALVRS
jgi:hypothetical protein